MTTYFRVLQQYVFPFDVFGGKNQNHEKEAAVLACTRGWFQDENKKKQLHNKTREQEQETRNKKQDKEWADKQTLQTAYPRSCKAVHNEINWKPCI